MSSSLSSVLPPPFLTMVRSTERICVSSGPVSRALHSPPRTCRMSARVFEWGYVAATVSSSRFPPSCTSFSTTVRDRAAKPTHESPPPPSIYLESPVGACSVLLHANHFPGSSGRPCRHAALHAFVFVGPALLLGVWSYFGPILLRNCRIGAD